MSKCPDCGMKVVGSACGACGWNRGGDGHSHRWAVKVDGAWIDLQCKFNDHGDRCKRQGTLSPSTNGHGPWYCQRHFGSSGIHDYSIPSLPGHPSGWVQAKNAFHALRQPIRQPGEDVDT